MNNPSFPANDREIINKVLDWFRVFAGVPHGSRNEKALSDLLAGKFIRLGWSVKQDRYGSLSVDIPASPSLEAAPRLIIQGHLDMVCAVKEGSGYQPEKDPITLIIKDGVLRSDGRSSLGADCGLGISAALSALSGSTLHGPVRLLLTTAEEIGLVGARLIDPSWLNDCRWLINIDGGDPGTVLVSCAGGRLDSIERPVSNVPRNGARAYEIALRAFTGGHSGSSIHLGRANAIRLLGNFLSELRSATPYELADFAGGHAPNAIPAEAHCVVVVNDPVPLHKAVCELRQQIAARFGTTDPGGMAELQEIPLPGQVWDTVSRDAVLGLITGLHNGAYKMNDLFPGLTSASSNIGYCHLLPSGIFQLRTYTRWDNTAFEEQLKAQYLLTAEQSGFSVKTDAFYPCWPGGPNNELVLEISRLYRSLSGKDISVKGTHAGLEPAVLGAKKPNLIMACIGPEIRNAHSTAECASLTSLPLFVRLLALTIEQLASRNIPD